MGKIAREMAAPLDENMAKIENRPVFDSKLWIGRDDGAYINTKTGEVREADEFARSGQGGSSDDTEDVDTELFHGDNDPGFDDSQDAGEWIPAAQVKTAEPGKNAKGKHK